MGSARACGPETASRSTVGAAARDGTIDGFGVGVGGPAGDAVADGDADAFTPGLVGVALGLRVGVFDGLGIAVGFGVGLDVGVAREAGLPDSPDAPFEAVSSGVAVAPVSGDGVGSGPALETIGLPAAST
jgi:hypothetical protein